MARDRIGCYRPRGMVDDRREAVGHNDTDHQERVAKFNQLLANCAIYSTALDFTDVANVPDPGPTPW